MADDSLKSPSIYSGCRACNKGNIKDLYSLQCHLLSKAHINNLEIINEANRTIFEREIQNYIQVLRTNKTFDIRFFGKIGEYKCYVKGNSLAHCMIPEVVNYFESFGNCKTISKLLDQDGYLTITYCNFHTCMSAVLTKNIYNIQPTLAKVQQYAGYENRLLSLKGMQKLVDQLKFLELTSKINEDLKNSIKNRVRSYFEGSAANLKKIYDTLEIVQPPFNSSNCTYSVDFCFNCPTFLHGIFYKDVNKKLCSSNINTNLVPDNIITFKDSHTNIPCTVILNPFFCHLQRVLSLYFNLDHNLTLIVTAIKHWLSIHSLRKTTYYSSHIVASLLIFYLQHPPFNFLPLSKVTPEEIERGRFESEPDILKFKETSLLQILNGFFSFYSKFDLRNNVVCLFLGETVTKHSLRVKSLRPKVFTTNEALTEKLVASKLFKKHFSVIGSDLSHCLSMEIFSDYPTFQRHCGFAQSLTARLEENCLYNLYAYTNNLKQQPLCKEDGFFSIASIFMADNYKSCPISEDSFYCWINVINNFVLSVLTNVLYMKVEASGISNQSNLDSILKSNGTIDYRCLGNCSYFTNWNNVYHDNKPNHLSFLDYLKLISDNTKKSVNQKKWKPYSFELIIKPIKTPPQVDFHIKKYLQESHYIDQFCEFFKRHIANWFAEFERDLFSAQNLLFQVGYPQCRLYISHQSNLSAHYKNFEEAYRKKFADHVNKRNEYEKDYSKADWVVTANHFNCDGNIQTVNKISNPVGNTINNEHNMNCNDTGSIRNETVINEIKTKEMEVKILIENPSNFFNKSDKDFVLQDETANLQALKIDNKIVNTKSDSEVISIDSSHSSGDTMLLYDDDFEKELSEHEEVKSLGDEIAEIIDTIDESDFLFDVCENESNTENNEDANLAVGKLKLVDIETLLEQPTTSNFCDNSASKTSEELKNPLTRLQDSSETSSTESDSKDSDVSNINKNTNSLEIDLFIEKEVEKKLYNIKRNIESHNEKTPITFNSTTDNETDENNDILSANRTCFFNNRKSPVKCITVEIQNSPKALYDNAASVNVHDLREILDKKNAKLPERRKSFNANDKRWFRSKSAERKYTGRNRSCSPTKTTVNQKFTTQGTETYQFSDGSYKRRRSDSPKYQSTNSLEYTQKSKSPQKDFTLSKKFSLIKRYRDKSVSPESRKKIKTLIDSKSTKGKETNTKEDSIEFKNRRARSKDRIVSDRKRLRSRSIERIGSRSKDRARSRSRDRYLGKRRRSIERRKSRSRSREKRPCGKRVNEKESFLEEIHRKLKKNAMQINQPQKTQLPPRAHEKETFLEEIRRKLNDPQLNIQKPPQAYTCVSSNFSLQCRTPDTDLIKNLTTLNVPLPPAQLYPKNTPQEIVDSDLSYQNTINTSQVQSPTVTILPKSFPVHNQPNLSDAVEKQTPTTSETISTATKQSDSKSLEETTVVECKAVSPPPVIKLNSQNIKTNDLLEEMHAKGRLNSQELTYLTEQLLSDFIAEQFEEKLAVINRVYNFLSYIATTNQRGPLIVRKSTNIPTEACDSSPLRKKRYVYFPFNAPHIFPYTGSIINAINAADEENEDESEEEEEKNDYEIKKEDTLDESTLTESQIAMDLSIKTIEQTKKEETGESAPENLDIKIDLKSPVKDEEDKAEIASVVQSVQHRPETKSVAIQVELTGFPLREADRERSLDYDSETRRRSRSRRTIRKSSSFHKKRARDNRSSNDENFSSENTQSRNRSCEYQRNKFSDRREYMTELKRSKSPLTRINRSEASLGRRESPKRSRYRRNFSPDRSDLRRDKYSSRNQKESRDKCRSTSRSLSTLSLSSEDSTCTGRYDASYSCYKFK